MEKFGSGIWDGKKVRSGIRDKHPGFATLTGLHEIKKNVTSSLPLSARVRKGI
jgi:hypothetical protein